MEDSSSSITQPRRTRAASGKQGVQNDSTQLEQSGDPAQHSSADALTISGHEQARDVRPKQPHHIAAGDMDFIPKSNTTITEQLLQVVAGLKEDSARSQNIIQQMRDGMQQFQRDNDNLRGGIQQIQQENNVLRNNHARLQNTIQQPEECQNSPT